MYAKILHNSMTFIKHNNASSSLIVHVRCEQVLFVNQYVRSCLLRACVMTLREGGVRASLHVSACVCVCLQEGLRDIAF